MPTVATVFLTHLPIATNRNGREFQGSAVEKATVIFTKGTATVLHDSSDYTWFCTGTRHQLAFEFSKTMD